MADFFSRLSERALGNATGVRPDLAPVIAWTAERNPSLENVDNEVTPTIRPRPRQTNLETQQHDRPTLVTQAPPISTNVDHVIVAGSRTLIPCASFRNHP